MRHRARTSLKIMRIRAHLENDENTHFHRCDRRWALQHLRRATMLVRRVCKGYGWRRWCKSRKYDYSTLNKRVCEIDTIDEELYGHTYVVPQRVTTRTQIQS
jgi:hypothetical protein